MWYILTITTVSLFGLCLTVPATDRQQEISTFPRASTDSGVWEETRADTTQLSLASLLWDALLGQREEEKKNKNFVFPVIKTINKNSSSLQTTDTADNFSLLKYKPSSVKKDTLQDKLSSLWQYVLAYMLSDLDIIHLDKRKSTVDDEKTNDDVVNTFTTVSYDPLGQVYNFIYNVLNAFVKHGSLKDWWEEVKTDLKAFSVFSEEVSLRISQSSNSLTRLLPTLPLTFNKKDLLKLAINWSTVFFVKSLFYCAYLPCDYDDYDDYEDLGEDDSDQTDENQEGGDGEVGTGEGGQDAGGQEGTNQNTGEEVADGASSAQGDDASVLGNTGTQRRQDTPDVTVHCSQPHCYQHVSSYSDYNLSYEPTNMYRTSLDTDHLRKQKNTPLHRDRTDVNSSPGRFYSYRTRNGHQQQQQQQQQRDMYRTRNGHQRRPISINTKRNKRPRVMSPYNATTFRRWLSYFFS